MDDAEKLNELCSKLIKKMRQQVANTHHQSFGNLSHHLSLLEQSVESNEIISPLYFIPLPRWMGICGNTDLESEILELAHKIDLLIIQLNGGAGKVNKLRADKSKNLNPR